MQDVSLIKKPPVNRSFGNLSWINADAVKSNESISLPSSFSQKNEPVEDLKASQPLPFHANGNDSTMDESEDSYDDMPGLDKIVSGEALFKELCEASIERYTIENYSYICRTCGLYQCNCL